jgi:hypothetical protein
MGTIQHELMLHATDIELVIWRANYRHDGWLARQRKYLLHDTVTF